MPVLDPLSARMSVKVPKRQLVPSSLSSQPSSGQDTLVNSNSQCYFSRISEESILSFSLGSSTPWLQPSFSLSSLPWLCVASFRTFPFALRSCSLALLTSTIKKVPTGHCSPPTTPPPPYNSRPVTSRSLRLALCNSPITNTYLATLHLLPALRNPTTSQQSHGYFGLVLAATQRSPALLLRRYARPAPPQVCEFSVSGGVQGVSLHG